MIATAIAAGAGALAGLAGVSAYAAMAPRSQLFGATFTGLAPGTRRLALTYDDGPNHPHTLRLLEVLERHNVKATFFLIGRYVRRRPEIAQAVARAGHAIGNHTFTHPNLFFTSPGQVRKELEDCQAVLREVVGEPATIFRPPFGARRPGVLRTSRALGLTPVMWTVTCYDWKETTADRVEQHARRQIRGGDVILLHDGGHLEMGADRAHTVEATDRLLRRYKDEGYQFVTVPEMMRTHHGATGTRRDE
ncbi:MAG TPA: polysaccharide deacetylase family protein [Terriglobales bacterium]|nr:polysaccharide deacetylase family protein [Terriglobales bacterium]